MATKFFSNRLTISGAAVSIVFEVGPREVGEQDHSLVALIQQALRTPAFQADLDATAKEQIKKSFGKKYACEPVEIDAGRRVISLSVTAVYVEVTGHKTLPKAAGEAMEKLRREIRRLLATLMPEHHVVVHGKWDAGPGVSNDEFIMLPDTDERELYAGLLKLQTEREQARAFTRVGLTVALMGVLAGAVLGAFLEWLIAAYAGFYALMGVAAWIIGRSRILDSDAKAAEIENEIELRALPADDILEKRAQKLFKVHAAELKRYYDQTLRQGRYIFYVGLGCLALGFGVIGASFALVVTATGSELSDKVIIGALGAIGGILANFIAVMYGRMFKETVAAVSGFHERLVLTHHLHFGNFLAAKIDDADKRRDTIALMAAALASVTSGDATQATAPETAASQQ